MQTFEASLAEVVSIVWSTALELPIAPDNLLGLPEHPGHTVAGVIQISGEWNGAVVIHVTERLAIRVTGIMLQMEQSAVVRGDIHDVLGEIVNMIGGNTKALLPEPSHLSLPVVVDGQDFRFWLPGASLVCRTAFRCEGEPVIVTVLQRVRGGAEVGAQ
jgi:chemotaxis protein CheX